MSEALNHPLKQWRGDRTQRVAAGLLDVDPMTYSRWERGLFLPRRKARSLIEERTGIPAERLVSALKDEAQ
jgi:transcriptional regulator with XRE-family HTH domain